MRVKFLATGNGPDAYSVSGNIITAVVGGISESFDLSALEYGGNFVGVSVDVIQIAAEHIIRDASRDAVGKLWVTLCQRAPAGHWRESDWIDAAAYVPGERYIVEVTNG